MKPELEQARAFTRVDLIAVISICAALSLLTLPLRGNADSESATIVCRTNKRQLIRALHLYTMDNAGLLPPNTGASAPGLWISTYGFAETPPTDAALTTPTNSLLANYLNRTARPFKCPADLTRTRNASGLFVAKIRQVSMNGAVGTDLQQPKNPTSGMWLDGFGSHTANRTWRCFSKLSDMVRPIPSELFVMLDEHPDSINDGYFGSVGPGPQSQKRWIDWPASYHNGSAGFGMADGSALMHKWVAPQTVSTVFNPQPPPLPASLPDINWLSDHTTALVTSQP
jgi:hypothetical protein